MKSETEWGALTPEQDEDTRQTKLESRIRTPDGQSQRPERGHTAGWPKAQNGGTQLADPKPRTGAHSWLTQSPERGHTAGWPKAQNGSAQLADPKPRTGAHSWQTQNPGLGRTRDFLIKSEDVDACVKYLSPSRRKLIIYILSSAVIQVYCSEIRKTEVGIRGKPCVILILLLLR